MIIDASLASDAGNVRDYLTSDGIRLRYRHWPAERPHRAMVIALHGIQSHSGWYGWSSRALAEVGIDVRFLDRRGSGLNRSASESVGNAEQLIDDVAALASVGEIAAFRNQSPEVPVILMGLSWGARLATAACRRAPELFNGLALLYPGLITRIGPTRTQSRLMRLAERLGGKRLSIRVPLDPEQFTSEPNWQSFIRHDPLALRRAPVSLLLAGEQMARLSRTALRTLSLPRLVMLAGRDVIVDLGATRQLLADAPQEMLCLIEYPEAKHTLEFEPVRDRFVADLIEWVESLRQIHSEA